MPAALRIFILLTLVAANSVPAFAVSPVKSFENLDRLDGLVAMTVGANIGQPGGPVAPIDRRLRLAACPQTPSIEGPVFGAAIVKCEAVGWRIRVPLSGGGAAPVQAAANPYAPGWASGTRAAVPQASREAVVRKGDPVQLLAGNESFTVTRMMVADENGAVGDMIRVRQDRNAPIVIARVEGMGVVRVPGI